MMNECAKQLAYLIRRGHDPLHEDQRTLLDCAFPVRLDEYKQVVCDVDGTHMMAWGYVKMPENKRAVILTWTDNTDNKEATGYKQYDSTVVFYLRGYHSWMYRQYMHAVRRILYTYDHIRGRHV